ncbi:hypothetical protein BBP40_004003 [Aspergillus hancockii]|nr:hypothetical protein BBP40_004003 [Aspergillus hancockii]
MSVPDPSIVENGLPKARNPENRLQRTSIVWNEGPKQDHSMRGTTDEMASILVSNLPTSSSRPCHDGSFPHIVHTPAISSSRSFSLLTNPGTGRFKDSLDGDWAQHMQATRSMKHSSHSTDGFQEAPSPQYQGGTDEADTFSVSYTSTAFLFLTPSNDLIESTAKHSEISSIKAVPSQLGNRPSVVKCTGWALPSPTFNLQPERSINSQIVDFYKAPTTIRQQTPSVEPNLYLARLKGSGISPLTRADVDGPTKFVPSTIMQGDHAPQDASPLGHGRGTPRPHTTADDTSSGSWNTPNKTQVIATRPSTGTLFPGGLPHDQLYPFHTPTYTANEFPPDVRRTLTGAAATNSRDNKSELEDANESQTIPKRGLGIAIGTVSGAIIIAVCIFLLHRPCYRWVRGWQRGSILIGHATTEHEVGSVAQPIRTQEISRFSMDS